MWVIKSWAIFSAIMNFLFIIGDDAIKLNCVEQILSVSKVRVPQFPINAENKCIFEIKTQRF